jgi:hypothetical protein
MDGAMTNKERKVQVAIGSMNLYALQLAAHMNLNGAYSSWGMGVAVYGIDMKDASDQLFKKLRKMTQEQRHNIMLGWATDYEDFLDTQFGDEIEAKKTWDEFWAAEIGSISIDFEHSYETNINDNDCVII